MFRLTLQRKLFIALALLLLLLLSMFIGFSRVALQRGIGPYVAEIELSRLDWMVGNLQRAYAREGNWDALRTDASAWHAAQMPGGVLRGPRFGHPSHAPGDLEADGPGTAPGGPPERPSRQGHQWGPQLDVLPERFAPPLRMGRPDDPRASAESVYGRLSLIAADGTDVIAGNPPAPGAVRTSIQLNGRTIGFLALAPLHGIGSNADRAFIEQQSSLLLYSGGAGLLLALLLSVLMARRWLRPLERLVVASRAVAGGQLDVVVPVDGDDEFAGLSRTFNAMAATLASIEKSRQRWLSDVAHELRTPVSAMRAEIEAVQDGVREFDGNTARRMHGQVMRLGKLVEDLGHVMRDGQEHGVVGSMEFRPLDVLSDAVESMQERLSQRGITVHGLAELQSQATTWRPAVVGDPSRLTQVFVNLLENSLRYTDPGGRLSLAAGLDAATPAQLEITFDDSAPAPSAEDFGRLFDRFFRGEGARARAQGGAGLGLAICKSIVQAHGGSITASASPLGGLRITILLPVKET